MRNATYVYYHPSCRTDGEKSAGNQGNHNSFNTLSNIYVLPLIIVIWMNTTESACVKRGRILWALARPTLSPGDMFPDSSQPAHPEEKRCSETWPLHPLATARQLSRQFQSKNAEWVMQNYFSNNWCEIRLSLMRIPLLSVPVTCYTLRNFYLP